MATIGHVAAGVALARACGRPTMVRTVLVMAAATAPDIDLLLGIDHRGATHSVGFSVVAALGAYVCMTLLKRPGPIGAGVLAAVAVWTHVVLDLLTARSPIRVFWPFTDREFVLRETPLPSAPADVSELLTAVGLKLLALELAWSVALVALAWLYSSFIAGDRGFSWIFKGRRRSS